MNISEAIKFTDAKLASGERSDGCTLVPDFGIRKWCVMHDMLRRFAPVPALEADNLYFKGIWSEGVLYWPIAIIYWLGVRLQYYVGTPGIIGIVFMTSFISLAYFNS
jgi:hypothetical protein